MVIIETSGMSDPVRRFAALSSSRVRSGSLVPALRHPHELPEFVCHPRILLLHGAHKVAQYEARPRLGGRHCRRRTLL